MSAAVHLPSLGLDENRRYAARHALRLGSTLTASGVEIVIHDISATGMLVESDQALALGETLTLDLPERGPTTATVTWASGRFHGCEFAWSLPAAVVSAALLKSAPVGAVDTSAAAGPDIAALQSLLVEAEADARSVADERYSLRTRGLVIGGFTLLFWGGAAALLTLG